MKVMQVGKFEDNPAALRPSASDDNFVSVPQYPNVADDASCAAMGKGVSRVQSQICRQVIVSCGAGDTARGTCVAPMALEFNKTRRRVTWWRMLPDPVIAFYALPLLVIWILYLGLRKRAEGRSRATLGAAAEAGMLEPTSLHPKIDPVKCLGCGACVRACPEGDVLGLINGKAQLIEPTECIGHGACKTACPRDAITLVFGTETRGVELPYVGPDFQTNVPGIFIAGELGGMGLIRNAIEQGGSHRLGAKSGRTGTAGYSGCRHRRQRTGSVQASRPCSTSSAS